MFPVPEHDQDGKAVSYPLRLVIASDIRFVRESLTEVLGRHPDLTVLGQGADTTETLGLSRDLRPDMILLDAAARHGREAIGRLRALRASLKLVVFAVSETAEAVLSWADAGIDGYIPSSAATRDLPRLIRDIGLGRQACSSLVAAALLQRVGARPPAAAKASPDQALTPRELQIVRLVGTGLSNKEIARRLDIGLATTKSHVHNAFAKLNLQRRSQVASWMHDGGATNPAGNSVGGPIGDCIGG
ncbi:response regulator transcription factor [Rhodopila sp.]|jgi:DNA-binding NarL/FixJ family response regulator|uniref:response regulator transcription factor n=1 Tax=Rhodopila sp. TaxID=2480087 RepID=UPI002C60E89A|nr:response regulator transcription factor [Rhodopila sp.]HVZ08865.1 response regulator transcription factor [Rhodopila sp.]